MAKPRSVKERVGLFGKRRGRRANSPRRRKAYQEVRLQVGRSPLITANSFSPYRRLRLANSVGELAEMLDTQGTKMSRTIGDLTTLLTLAHTMSLLNKNTAPVFQNTKSALEGLLGVKTFLTTARLYLQRMVKTKEGKKVIQQAKQLESDKE